ncbi:uncharacterized protein SPPG_03289 [Spizellomyces punctatus DAOM BR117]|uniref:chitin synthase n=1 Tax=Spizellomyces punctatus (strain DAOM BR117) TaxID=645134 RepID=A0A0L0HKC9_SPIPD|nr:uncharacterized protein SPPG_03289 [Spizellomyces punctatus DAOM BR117]KND01488.1 hypothetical protein SPPG_03289 [Spizellomyces punctatus DAOM BR117]|eukprot:XP_016609527.1 hypothetical protein SPPG_03289 [Spizellomyces punctatus DAOM BR117]
MHSYVNPHGGMDLEELPVDSNATGHSSLPGYTPAPSPPSRNFREKALPQRPSGLPMPPATYSIPNYTDIFPARYAADADSVEAMRKSMQSARRAHTLSRPERQRSTRRAILRSPSAGPPAARAGATRHRNPLSQMPEGAHKVVHDYADNNSSEIWPWFARIVTCCFLPPCLRACGKTERAVQQAWREKVALCMIIAVICGMVAFLTVGLQRVLCPSSTNEGRVAMFNKDTKAFNPGSSNTVIISGYEYNFQGVQAALQARGFVLDTVWSGVDISRLFAANADGSCGAYYTSKITCTFPNSVLISPTGNCADIRWVQNVKKVQRFTEWNNVDGKTKPPHALTVYNGALINLTDYLTGPQQASNRLTPLFFDNLGKDGTYSYVRTADARHGIECLQRTYRVGFVGEETTGCISSMVIQTVSLIIILGVVISRFLMAIWFHWFGSPNLTKKPRHTNMPVPVGSNGRAPYSGSYSGSYGDSSYSPNGDADLYTILLVTCYSEGEEGIRGTLDSLANTDFPDDKKLLFVVADGLITGSGNDRSTPDIIIGMMEQDSRLPAPEPKSYIAIADGTKQHNMAKVYAGHYVLGNHRVPMIAVVKCGTPTEATQPKPGNRGKRDSQLIIMNFLSRTLFNDRMTALDYELFYRIQQIATTADMYEAILMVDADTKVAPDSLGHMVSAMKNDVSIMGLCGETRIANKTASFTSAIQVFEYYISHHLGKAFESVFGGVTCLPGCFCMYRIKAPKGDMGATVPIITNPGIVEEYSENVVDTLHKKNLLLLGEDRFLSTLMLRNFPHRKMVFVPQAICWTMVPEKFRVLLSQRRRWINSTVHNLLELVLVRDLCGTFCFSMQFVVLLELVGTVVLPVAICLTLYLIISAVVSQSAEVVPFLMLAAILGLPGLLIIVTTRKFVYIMWMLVYLISLPIWNFVLPAYAYWHFDDFSWGETRKVEGEQKGDFHGKKEGQFESSAVSMKKWAEWERDRLLFERYQLSSEHDKETEYRQQNPRLVTPQQAPHPSHYSYPHDQRASQLGIPAEFPYHPVSVPPPPRERTSMPPTVGGVADWPPPPGGSKDQHYPPLLMGGLPRPPAAFPSNRPVSSALFPRSESDLGPSYEMNMTAPRPTAASGIRNGSIESALESSSSGSSSSKGKQRAI